MTDLYTNQQPPQSPRLPVIYVAIVCNKPNMTDTSITKRPGAVTGLVKKQVIEAAIAIRDEWQSRGNGPYVILVGELMQEVKLPVHYELRPLEF